MFLIVIIELPLYGQQISIDRINQMPNLPQPYLMRDWKFVAKGYDSLVFSSLSGTYLPLNKLYSNTVNYPGSQSFKLQSYVGSPDFGGEGINCLPAVIGAELAGINKKNQNGIDWVSMCKEWFNTLPSEKIYLNGPRATNGDDWWYETMPNVFFYQLYSLHPDVNEFQTQTTIVADRWLEAVQAMGGSSTPWTIPNMDHRAWKFSTMMPYDNDVHEPEASGAIAWILYQAYIKTGNQKYRIGAELAMEFLNDRSLNPSYELQLSYGTYLAARMNAELGTQYNLQKLFTWCFNIGPLRSWGATLGKWGAYDCSGLIGEVQQFNPSYAFLMNTFQQVGTLAPIARYDDRYANALGKWILNAANAVRLFYPNFLPDSNQDSRAWSLQYDEHSFIGHEAMRQSQLSKSPFATGDAIQNNWAETNLALYGSSHVGYLGAVVETTDVAMVLQLNLLATDFRHTSAYPTFLYYNPYDSTVAVSINVGGSSVDLYDAVANVFVKSNVINQTTFDIPSYSSRVIVLAPSGGTITYNEGKMLIDNVVVDYSSDHIAGNHPPRIKAVSTKKDTVTTNSIIELFCTAEDIDGDSISIAWSSSHGILPGSGSQITWTVPDSEGIYSIFCTVKDSKNAETVDTISLNVVKKINHSPTIQKIHVLPRKINLNSSAQINCYAADSDSDTLQYTWSSSNGTFFGSGSSVSWQSPSTAGNFWLKCIVDDNHGGIVYDSIAVEVRDFSLYTKGNVLAYYPFNGNANDASGNNRNGTAANVLLVPDRNGNLNSAYSFDGVTSSVQIPNDNGLNTQNAIAINFWMKIGAFYYREQYPISHGNWQNRWKVSISNNRLRWTVKTSTGIKDLDSETGLQIDSLYNVTVLYGNGEMELYLNGELDAFAPWSGTIQTTSTALTIGQSLPNDNNYNFNGVLDDVRIFDYELSPDEIAAFSSRVTSVKNYSTKMIPEKFSLESFPNPFNPSTTIQFSLPIGGYVLVNIYDVLGREIESLVHGQLPPGVFEQRWTADQQSSGVYFCVLKVSNNIFTKKLILMR